MAENEHKHGDMDIQEQENTFNGFVSFMTWSITICIVVLLFLAIFAS